MGERLARVIDLSARRPRCCPHCDDPVALHELWQHVNVCRVLTARRAGDGREHA